LLFIIYGQIFEKPHFRWVKMRQVEGSIHMLLLLAILLDLKLKLLRISVSSATIPVALFAFL
jgi:hypothetical protein